MRMMTSDFAESDNDVSVVEIININITNQKEKGLQHSFITLISTEIIKQEFQNLQNLHFYWICWNEQSWG